MNGRLRTAIKIPKGTSINSEPTILNPVTPPSDTLLGIKTASNP